MCHEERKHLPCDPVLQPGPDQALVAGTAAFVNILENGSSYKRASLISPLWCNLYQYLGPVFHDLEPVPPDEEGVPVRTDVPGKVQARGVGLGKEEAVVSGLVQPRREEVEVVDL